MIIRQQQVGAFNEAAREQFVARAVAHVQAFAPKHTEVLGDEGTRVVVKAGMERAGKYGLLSSGPLHSFLELMFTLGSEFDSDPQYPWAAQVLNDGRLTGEMPKADALYAQASQYLDRVAGPDYEHAMAALKRVKTIDLGRVGEPHMDFTQRSATILRTLYPQKADYLGALGVSSVIQRGLAKAQAHGINTEGGALLFVGLEFTLGHAFDHDPRYPWIASTLNKETPASPEDRARRLYQKTKTYVDHSVQYLEQGQNGKV